MRIYFKKNSKNRFFVNLNNLQTGMYIVDWVSKMTKVKHKFILK